MTKNYEVFYIWISTDHLFNIVIEMHAHVSESI